MKKLITAALVSLTMTGAALASGPTPGPIVPLPPVAPASQWDGFYMGAVAGYGAIGSVHCDGFDCVGGDITDNPMPNSTGGALGLTLGMNFASGNFVYGIEGDYMAANMPGAADSTLTYGCGGGNGCETNIQGMATLRGRVGLDKGNFLPFLTAGVAVLNVEGLIGGTGDTGTVTSPVAGIGAEMMLSGGWSAKAEYLYLFDSTNFLYAPGLCVDPGCALQDASGGMVRFGLNKHF